MRKLYALLTFSLACTFVIAQGPKFYLSNTLDFKNQQAQKIPNPFVGGLISPQFSNIDLDQDGTQDLFIFDRGTNRSMTFLRNTGPGYEWIYAPQFEFGFPKMTKWALLVDYNGDGKEDIFTAADPNNFSQSIAVYKNVTVTGVGIPIFELVAEQLLYDQNITGIPFAPIFNVDGDVSAFTDIDNDGDIDILTFDASAAQITLYGNESFEKGYPLDSLVFRAFDLCWGNFIESFIDRSITLGTPCFGGKYYKKSSGMHSGATMLILDNDNDGDKDLILGDASYPELSLLTNGKADKAWPFDTIIAYDTVFPKTNKIYINNFPAAFYVDVTNDGVKDLLAAPNLAAGGKNLNQVWYYKNNGTNTLPNFGLVRKNFIQDSSIDFGSGAAPAFVDVDNDGDLDMVLAHRGDYEMTLNRADRMELYRNTGDKKAAIFQHENITDYLGLLKDSIRDMKPTFGDLNGDGKPDMLIGESEGTLLYYQNITTTGPLTFAAPVKNYMGIDVGIAAAPQIVDLDEDGKLDLAIGTGGGFINYYRNKGDSNNPLFDPVPTKDTLGGVYVNDWYYHYVLDDNTGVVIDTVQVFNDKGYAVPQFYDLDEDGKLDLLVGCLSGDLLLYNNIKGNLSDTFTKIDTFVYNNISKELGGYNTGMRNTPAVAKLSDSTGAKPAVIMGNFGGGINFLKPLSDTSAIEPTRGISDVYRELTVAVYPNPATYTINISRSLQQYDGDVSYTMVDMLGHTILKGTIEAGNQLQTLQLFAIQQGIYYLQLRGGTSFQSTQKITILR